MNIEEIKEVNPESYQTAINTILFFGLEPELEDKEGRLYEYRSNFVRPQEDVLKCMISELEFLGIDDYTDEIKVAEKQLERIVNTFIEKWGDDYSIDKCAEETDKIFYLMVMSAYGHGVGLWEVLDDGLGHYPTQIETICWDIGFNLVDKILQAYEDQEEDFWSI
jgi:hypothetical protein